PLAVFCPSCSLKASFLLSAQSPLPTVSRLSMLPGSLPIGPRLPKSRSSLHAPQRSALRSFPPPIRPPKSTKNALSISMRAQPRSGFALWTVLFPSFLLLISKYLVLPSARIFPRTSRDFAPAASACALGKQRGSTASTRSDNSGSPALHFIRSLSFVWFRGARYNLSLCTIRSRHPFPAPSNGLIATDQPARKAPHKMIDLEVMEAP